MKAEFINEGVMVCNFDVEDLEKLKKFNTKFELVVFKELQKISAFYHARMREVIKRWRHIKINVILLRQARQRPEYENYRNMLKNTFQLFYKELKLLSEYITINLEAFRKIFKKHRKYTKTFDDHTDLKARFEEQLRDKNVHYHKECLSNMISHVELEYLDLFFNRGNRKEGQEELRKILQGRLISQHESFYFGFFFGLCIAFILLMTVIGWIGDLKIDHVFPIFRGIGMLILYVWLLAWNVYIWTKFNINYKLIFKFTEHYSTVSEILGRAALFTAVFLTMFLWYVILSQEMPFLSEHLDFFPKDYTPLIVWLLFLGYIFFPSKTLFNPQGRLYVYKLVKEIITSPFQKPNFRLNWATDQLASFVVPLKDFEYLLCFYSTFSIDGKMNCQFASTRFSSAVLMAFIPLSLRMIQCARQMYEAKVFISPFFFNLLKYFMSVVVVVFSFFWNKYNEDWLRVAWITSAIVSTLFSYYWDLKMDWGFLDAKSKNYPLPKELAYNNKSFYYAAMSVNFFLRCAWVFSISPDVSRRIARPDLFTALIGFLEIFRRSIWNLLRVEKEHIANCGTFKAVDDYKLPFDKIEINMDEKYLFRNELMTFLENDRDDVDDVEDLESRDLHHLPQFKKVPTEPVHEILDPDGDKKDHKIPLLSPSKSSNQIHVEKQQRNIKRVTSLLNISQTNLTEFKLDPIEIETIKREVKEFKQQIKDKAERFEVTMNIDLALLRNPSMLRSTKHSFYGDPEVTTTHAMTKGMHKVTSFPLLHKMGNTSNASKDHSKFGN